MDSEYLHQFLSEIEDEEIKLLNWNITHASISEEELDDRIFLFLERNKISSKIDSREFKNDLIGKLLIFSFQNCNGEIRYRSRIAEFVRLLANLRQLFPERMKNHSWLTSPRLISDFRILMKPRQYPKRNVSFDDLLNILKNSNIENNLMALIAKAILGNENLIKLSDFQVRSTVYALSELAGKNHGRNKGMIVCAGTGSGKTLSFYLPTLMYLSSILDSSYWVKCLAIYPRNELLKDQLFETLKNVNNISLTLAKNGKRTIRIGVLYGATPKCAATVGDPKYGWKKGRNGVYICPFVKCPNCESELVWNVEDNSQKKERLFCRHCNKYVTDENFVLTRERLTTNPPDILFVSTEMINRKITDSSYSRLLINSEKPPKIMLLDEIHTYTGLNGAQIALLLRRWKYMAKANPFIVGLSATLTSPKNFFHELTSIKKDDIEEISPSNNELENGYREYFIVAKGETASKTNLLSSTIQSSMLLSRILDSKLYNKSNGMFGNRLFVFTDDLDVTNRLYWDLREAEGIEPLRNNSSYVLASLRSSRYSIERGIFQDGQYWKICEDLGYRLRDSERKEVSRTSSQDVGVSDNSDIVIATASLEVGYNDPSIGAVLQHKSPRDNAQFIQRRGRAGRRREMRPITLTILSDYGRDRITYQMYEKLFSPILEEKCIPVDNKYILKMQATFAFMDWLSLNIPKTKFGSIWYDVSAPDLNSSYRQNEILAVCEKLLDNDSYMISSLQNFIKTSLNISKEVAEELMWLPPRSIMNTVIPTLHRRISSSWSGNFIDGKEKFEWGQPLPEFVPSNLFSDLNLPELAIRIISNTDSDKFETFYMPLLQGMKEFAPGKVTLRFGIEYARHWVVPNDFCEPFKDKILLNEFCDKFEELGYYKYAEDDKINEIRCVRPLQYSCKIVPGRIRESSNATLVWHTQIVKKNGGSIFPVSSFSNRNSCLESFEFFTHKQNSSIEIRRFATGSKAIIITEDNKEPVNVDMNFYSEDSKPVVLGFALDVDGLRIKLKNIDLIKLITQAKCLPELRILYFDYLLKNKIEMFKDLSVFLLDWVSQIFLISVIRTAMKKNSGINEAINEISNNFDIIHFEEALNFVIGNNGDGNDISKLREDLELFLSSKEKMMQIFSISRVLWNEPNRDWIPWLEKIYKSTIGGAFIETLRKFDPEINTESIVFDMGSDADTENSFSIYFTEDNIGGIGEIEKFMNDFCQDSNAFFDLFIETINNNEYEFVNSQLLETLELVNSNVSDFAYYFDQIRNSASFDDIQNHMNSLLKEMNNRGMILSHAFIASLSHRLLRPGLDSNFDCYISNLYKKWLEIENKLDLSIEPRVWAACQNIDELDELTYMFEIDEKTENWYYKLVLNLIWTRGLLAQKNLFNLRFIYSKPYDMLPKFVAMSYQSDIPCINYHSDNFIEQFNDILANQGIVDVEVTLDSLSVFKKVMIDLLLTPIESEFNYMTVYPFISKVRKNNSGWKFCFEIIEVN